MHDGMGGISVAAVEVKVGGTGAENRRTKR